MLFKFYKMVKFQMLLQFEKELAQAVEALTKEQEKAAQAEREKQSQVVICRAAVMLFSCFLNL